MKLNHLLALIISMLFLASCNNPIGNSLLSNESSSCDSITGCTDSTTTGDPVALEIQAANSTMSLPMEQSDTIEITGTCQDLGRKNNRILVEVYAAEDETADPYINNAISDYCYPSTNTVRSGLETVFLKSKSALMGFAQSSDFSASGGTGPYIYSIVSGDGSIAADGVYTAPPATSTVAIIQVQDANFEVSRATVSVMSGITTPVVSSENKKCFQVTKGIGRVEDAGLPNERTFPQCHNGQFGFSVRLGKVLVNPTAGQPNYKYLVRYKLRTQEGTISDSTWGRVTVERSLSAPIITSATNVHATQRCTINTEPARFNFGILYKLSRTFTDIAQTNVATVPDVYASASTGITTVGSSVFSWDDIGLADGVTYNYTLTSEENNFGYSPAAPTAASSVVSCETKRIYVKQTQTPTAGVCYLGLQDAGSATEITIFNPYVTYQWGYMDTGSGWIGVGDNDGKTNVGFTVPPALNCGNSSVCSASGLTGGVTYYFALRALGSRGEIGKWSFPVACKPL